MALFFFSTPACASAGLSGFWVVGPPSIRFGPVLYRVHSITYSSPRCVIACSRYSEPPRYGVSRRYHGTGSLAVLSTESPGAHGPPHGGSPALPPRYGAPDACLPNMFHWGAHRSRNHSRPLPFAPRRSEPRAAPYGPRLYVAVRTGESPSRELGLLHVARFRLLLLLLLLL